MVDIVHWFVGVRDACTSHRSASRRGEKAGMLRPRVLLADDHALVLGALAAMLVRDCDVVGTVADGRALLAAAAQLQPDVIVLDIAMPLLNGLDAARQIKRAFPRIKLIVLTMNEDAELAAATFRAGASAYLLKHSAAGELLTAIREVTNGRSYITPLVAEGWVAALLHHRETPAVPELTSRQREVLQLLAEGHSMKQIADVLKVTPRTVAFHKYRMMAQLNITSTAALIEFAVKGYVV
jgi:DNA-binding NarL/FixJ family response regulator